MNKNPCKNCDRRTLTCHDTCEEHKAFQDVERGKREALKGFVKSQKETEYRLRREAGFKRKQKRGAKP